MNEEGKGAESRDFFAEEPNVFPGRPRMHDIRGEGVRKKTRPIAIDLIATLDRIVLLAQASPSFVIFSNSDRKVMPQRRQLVGEIMHVDSALRAEEVIEDKKDVTHGLDGCSAPAPGPG